MKRSSTFVPNICGKKTRVIVSDDEEDEDITPEEYVPERNVEQFSASRSQEMEPYQMASVQTAFDVSNFYIYD